ncbi:MULTISPECIES: helix-turn-helix domain-containing protein [unclassified Streptomyces]|uniref:GbsR/MarR family transcriptional regulator n=1 Tax=unclassified Streptomyces TaxID=2593676 RepID=UPI002DD7CCF7|nr:MULTISPECIES: helix-turn-helix domain-containing protein [unclassified Streptomyces]WSB79628.1 helix-turn-helix domain-containing protein [Streptomyces sp. NBC_01775]WSS12169.1 helix-turn-helix domain-containing protein [Streptomyces sp. NBC_01186]WSS40880.1 helix-turn-helix domain-containing protein [Streptomyces sp. NBC_01187]
MPGGRLTYEDRRGIAAGLAEGLGYAAIARRLNRPTSTVSREVARNGGTGGYRPDHAHHATAHRARRRRETGWGAESAPSGTQRDAAEDTAGTTDGYGRDPGAVRAFGERFAALLTRTGVPRMPARVLTCLVTTDSGALTAAELVERLRVSAASVSKAVGYLEGLEVIRRERVSGGTGATGPNRRRRDRYVVDDGVWLRAWATSARKTTLWAEAAREGTAALGPGTPAGARLGDMSVLFARLGGDMAGGPGDAAVSDVRTVAAALVHTAPPLTADQLATALGWHRPRVIAALHDAERRPDLTDPVAVGRAADGGWSAAARNERLTPAQREALGRFGGVRL